MNTSMPDSKMLRTEAEWLAALAEPTRLAIVRALVEGEKTQKDLCGILRIESGLVSHHIRLLAEAGVVKSRREGKFFPNSLAKATVQNGVLELTSPTGLKLLFPLW
jgi:ArsR family transcriptional regulator